MDCSKLYIVLNRVYPRLVHWHLIFSRSVCGSNSLLSIDLYTLQLFPRRHLASMSLPFSLGFLPVITSSLFRLTWSSWHSPGVVKLFIHAWFINLFTLVWSHSRRPYLSSPPRPFKLVHGVNLPVIVEVLMMSSQLEIASKFGLISGYVLPLSRTKLGLTSGKNYISQLALAMKWGQL